MDTALVVYLNVGGVSYVTRRSTLLECESSFFSGIVKSHPECAEIFIDRDPMHFRYILNWMRGVRHLPEEDSVLRELVWEADYYCLGSMKDAIVHTRDRFSVGRTLHSIAGDLRAR